MKRTAFIAGLLFLGALSAYAEDEISTQPDVAASTATVSASTDTATPPVINASTAAATPVLPPMGNADTVVGSSNTFSAETSTEPAVVEKVSIDDSGTQLLVLIHTSKPVQCFLFERQDPPSLFVQFLSTPVFAAGTPIQVVGIDPLSEIRYGFSSFNDATSGARDPKKQFQIDYIELKLTRPIFHSVQQQGWVVVVRLDRTTTKVDIPELDFRFDVAKYEGANSLPPDPRVNDFVAVSQANSRLLSVAREEVTLAKSRVLEAQRALGPALTARVSSTRGKEVNPFPKDDRFIRPEKEVHASKTRTIERSICFNGQFSQTIHHVTGKIGRHFKGSAVLIEVLVFVRIEPALWNDFSTKGSNGVFIAKDRTFYFAPGDRLFH